ncbi:XdhC/CoxI family protein [Streptomyces sp. MP131-18]|uniref:XdhC family protein n=1 Tax=Streptomyces sp. MP131-18 TaxID=1857892 RepID=UPI00097CB1EC|nr:XdhC/CoxI family protein [Streptomyces sp. MP131-18]ONK14329.1 putative xanthine dehydrogenase subunit A [Streptomyces sp. MP131-18]
MLDIAADLHRWCAEGRDFAVATITAVGGSAPRQPGAALAVDAEGTAVGSVSSGCVEAAVYELCVRSLATGSTLVERFAAIGGATGGAAGEDPFAVGLTCGGTIDVLVTPVRTKPEARQGAPERSTVEAALAAATSGRPAALARVVEGPDHLVGRALHVRGDGSREGTLGSAALDRAAARQATVFVHGGRTGTLCLGTEGGPGCGEPVSLFVETSLPPPRMLVFGAVDFAAALARAGRFLGYRVTVCDVRPVFTTAARFPEADEVITEWPHRYLDAQRLDARTAICVLTHDARFDIPLLRRALRLPVAYVGAMGSHRTHLARVEELRAVGVTGAELARLRSPIGLDLGGRTPEETALSIVAEIVALRNGGSGVPLTGGGMAIHHDHTTLPSGPGYAGVRTA